MHGAIKQTRGSSVVEYVLLVGLIAIACIGGFHAFGQTVDAKAEAHARCVSALACGAGAASTPEATSSEHGGDDAASGTSHGEGHVESADAPARPPRSIPRRVWDFVAGFFKQAWSMIPATIEVVTHPIQTIEAVGYAVAHPIETYHAVKDAISEAWRENPEDVAGRITFEVVTLPFIVSKVSKLRAIATAEKVLHLRYARALRGAEHVKRIVENGSRVSHGAHAGEIAEHEEEEHEAEPSGEDEGTGHREPVSAD